MQNKKLMSIILSLIMITSMAPTSAFAMELTDMPNNWSTSALQSAVDNGLLKGDKGKISPNEYLTRAQMVTIVNRAFSATEKASISSFTDVAAGSWYYDEVAKAVQMKTILGSGYKLNPNNNITREEAFVVLARAFKLSNATENNLGAFSDGAMVSSWAKDSVASLVAAGYVSGSKGKLNPQQFITRAEFAQIMDNLLKNYIKTPGTYTTEYTGNVMINVPDVTLKNTKINGDLIIGDGVGNGDVTLDGVTVTGRTIVRGGGVNSIKIMGTSSIQNIVIARVDGQVRVYAEDGTMIGDITVDGSDDVIIEGSVGTVTVLVPEITVTAKNAEIGSVTIQGENSKFIVGTNSTVSTLYANVENAKIEVQGQVTKIETSINAENASIIVAKDGKVGSAVINGEGTTFGGDGSLTSVLANADNVAVNIAKVKVTAAPGTDGVTAGTIPVKAGSTATSDAGGGVLGVIDIPGSSAPPPTPASDTTIPIITLNGSATVNLAYGATYTDAGATASDNKDGDITASIATTGTVDTMTAGTYTIHYKVSDAAGNAAVEVLRTVVVADPIVTPDTTKPVITLNGSGTVNLAYGATYTDAGATASDNKDGDITASIATTGTVDTMTAGTYTIHYKVSDAAGNAAVEVLRTVNVAAAPDTTKPVITLVGSATVNLAYGATYTEAGATAMDNKDGDITANIAVTGTVDPMTAGTYTIHYNVSDAAGNAAVEVLRTVVVADPIVTPDTTKPVITLNGSRTVNLAYGATYTEAGATALDNIDGNITAKIAVTGTVDTMTAGTYTVHYNVSDAAGNAAVEVLRTVVVADPIVTPDTTKPVITLNGSGTVNLAYGATYTEAGATAMDNIDGNITAKIAVTGTVDTMTAGTYTIHYNVSDAAGNAAVEVTRTVNVATAPDTTKPVITLVGSATVNLAYGATYTEAGATALDNIDGNITAKIAVTGTVDTMTAGTYTVHYNVSDAAGNAAVEVLRTVVVADPIVTPDTTKPVITLNGSATVNLANGATYTEAGASAMDNKDGDITAKIAVTGTVDTMTAGTYTIHYNVSDAAGNAAVEVTRTVNVATAPDTTKPVITLNGSATVNLANGATYTEAGATAMDNKDGDITAKIAVTGTVDTMTAGTYTIHYNVSDAAGNAAVEVTRTVNVAAAPDTTKPVITLVGSATVNLAYGATYTEAGATAMDNKDGDITANIITTGTVDPMTAGTYIIHYNVSDAAGNAAVEVLRTVNVAAAPDTTKPVITLVGSATVNLAYGATYTEAGATALDNKDGDITANIITTGTVDPMTAGTYIIHYNVSDAAGNAAVEVLRTVNVAAAPDTTKPVITLAGSATVNLAYGATYTEAGATALDNKDGDITANIITTGTVDPMTAGTYIIHYNVSDAAGNAAVEVTRTVNVAAAPDTTKPVITLAGSATVNLAYGATYTEAGATAMDNIDGNITAKIAVTGTVDPMTAGTYIIHYNVSDAAGNAAVEVTRTVNVAAAPDTTKPVITLVGSATVNLAYGATYTEAGATAMDNKDGDITAKIAVTGTVDPMTAGTYIIHYNVSDAAGNAAVEVLRTVNVAAAPDTTKPVITLVGSATVNLAYGATYTEAGATAMDNIDGNITAKIAVTGTVDPMAAGTYIIHYNVSDAAGNAAVEVLRTVNVAAVPDTTKPVITLVGSATVNLAYGATYTEAGATALDNKDGDITANIITTGTVDPMTAGTYIIHYNVSDAAGNAAVEVTRTVTVAAPVITATMTLIGEALGIKSYGIQVTGAQPGDVTQVIVNNVPVTYQVISGLVRFNSGTTVTSVKIIALGQTISVSVPVTITATATLVGEALGVKSYGIQVTGAAPGDVTQVLVNSAPVTFQVINGLVRFNSGTTVTSIKITALGQTIDVVVQ